MEIIKAGQICSIAYPPTPGHTWASLSLSDSQLLELPGNNTFFAVNIYDL